MKIINIEDYVLNIRNKQVLLDRDVAKIYGVTTKEVNQAVGNNPEKFPEGYILKLSNIEKRELVKNIDRLQAIKHSTVTPKAFTEKGLYMLATILKSPQAVSATIAIIETFTKIRELAKTINKLSNLKERDEKNALMKKSGEIFSEILDEGFQTTDTETSIEINFAVMKFKHTLKKRK